MMKTEKTNEERVSYDYQNINAGDIFWNNAGNWFLL